MVGRKGSRRVILAPLLHGEYMDKEGMVLRERQGGQTRYLSGSRSSPEKKTPQRENLTASTTQGDREEEQIMLQNSLGRASPGGHLGGLIVTSGRRPSVSQEQWTPTGKRKGRGSKGTPETQDKRFKEGDWTWEH